MGKTVELEMVGENHFSAYCKRAGRRAIFSGDQSNKVARMFGEIFVVIALVIGVAWLIRAARNK